jgi:hypothetical protein
MQPPALSSDLSAGCEAPPRVYRPKKGVMGWRSLLRTVARSGYNARALAELLNARPAEIRAFLHGQLAPGRTQELHAQLLAAGLPV